MVSVIQHGTVLKPRRRLRPCSLQPVPFPQISAWARAVGSVPGGRGVLEAKQGDRPTTARERRKKNEGHPADTREWAALQFRSWKGSSFFPSWNNLHWRGFPQGLLLRARGAAAHSIVLCSLRDGQILPRNDHLLRRLLAAAKCACAAVLLCAVPLQQQRLLLPCVLAMDATASPKGPN